MQAVYPLKQNAKDLFYQSPLFPAAFDIPFALEIGEDAWHGVSSLKAEDANIGFFKSEYAGWFDRAICWLKKKLFVENA